MRSSGGTSGTRTAEGTRTAASRGARAAPGRSGRRGRRLAGGAMGTAAGRTRPPGEAGLGSPIPGTGSGALAETPVAAELWVSVWGEGGSEPAQACSKLLGCHGWTFHLGASPLPLVPPWARALHAACAAGWDRGLSFNCRGCQAAKAGSSRMLPFPKSLGAVSPSCTGGRGCRVSRLASWARFGPYANPASSGFRDESVGLYRCGWGDYGFV